MVIRFLLAFLVSMVAARADTLRLVVPAAAPVVGEMIPVTVRGEYTSLITLEKLTFPDSPRLRLDPGRARPLDRRDDRRADGEGVRTARRRLSAPRGADHDRSRRPQAHRHRPQRSARGARRDRRGRPRHRRALSRTGGAADGPQPHGRGRPFPPRPARSATARRWSGPSRSRPRARSPISFRHAPPCARPG